MEREGQKVRQIIINLKTRLVTHEGLRLREEGNAFQQSSGVIETR